MPRPLTTEEFWAHGVRDPITGCLEWQGFTIRGYGSTTIRQKRWLIHRYAYFLATGVHPGDLFVLHRCDNPPCYEPSHLYLGTAADNSRDMMARHRQNLVSPELQPSAKLNWAKVAEIRERVKRGEGFRALGREFGVCHHTIRNIAAHRTWRVPDDGRPPHHATA